MAKKEILFPFHVTCRQERYTLAIESDPTKQVHPFVFYGDLSDRVGALVEEHGDYVYAGSAVETRASEIDDVYAAERFT